VRATLYLITAVLLAASAAASESPALVTVPLSPVYSIGLPIGSEARTKNGALIATLGSTADGPAFGSTAGRAIAEHQEIVLLPTPSQGERRIEIGWTQSAEYARRINSMSRLDYIMHQTIMKQAFLRDLAKKPGQHAAESSAITFHDKYRGTFYLSLSKTSTGVVGRLVLDIFRGDAMYSSTFHWAQPSIEDRDALVDQIIDSVQVAE
jgi:hypothetical protein